LATLARHAPPGPGGRVGRNLVRGHRGWGGHRGGDTGGEGDTGGGRTHRGGYPGSERRFPGGSRCPGGVPAVPGVSRVSRGCPGCVPAVPGVPGGPCPGRGALSGRCPGGPGDSRCSPPAPPHPPVSGPPPPCLSRTGPRPATARTGTEHRAPSPARNLGCQQDLQPRMPSQLEHAMETLMFTFHKYAGDKEHLAKEDLRALMDKEFPGFLENQRDPHALDRILRDVEQSVGSDPNFPVFPVFCPRTSGTRTPWIASCGTWSRAVMAASASRASSRWWPG
uniref:Protein S100-A10 n=1 Tax=Taeniopygia guttata TaxID=59729 RepID=A0A674HB71_TAEGU